MTAVQTNSERQATPDVRRRNWGSVVPWLIPAANVSISPLLSSWKAMWLIAFSVFTTCKWLTWRSQHVAHSARWRHWAYFAAWPGLDADRFLDRDRVAEKPEFRELLVSTLLTICGAIAIWIVVPRISHDRMWWKGALGFFGILLFLHFGSFGLLSWCWRRAGVDAPSLMDRPFLATSLADFWGRRWNRAYRRVSHDLFYQPITARFGPTIGLLGAFLASGLIHELAISVPARGGYGGPTIYFLIHGLGMLWERTPKIRHFIRRQPALGRVLAAVFVLAPVGLLFHAPFLTRVIAPFLRAIEA